MTSKFVLTWGCVWGGVFVLLTLALVNWTIGPSSDTTWFPTWTKGTLPRQRGRERQRDEHKQGQTEESVSGG